MTQIRQGVRRVGRAADLTSGADPGASRRSPLGTRRDRPASGEAPATFARGVPPQPQQQAAHCMDRTAEIDNDREKSKMVSLITSASPSLDIKKRPARRIRSARADVTCDHIRPDYPADDVAVAQLLSPDSAPCRGTPVSGQPWLWLMTRPPRPVSPPPRHRATCCTPPDRARAWEVTHGTGFLPFASRTAPAEETPADTVTRISRRTDAGQGHVSRSG